MKMKKIIIMAIAMIILFSGCVDKSDKVQPTPTSTETPTATETPNTQVPKVVDFAKEDLASTLSISVDDIKLSNIEEVTWPTTALGYPKIGEQYLQVETPGFKIFLTYNNTIYEYHSDTEKIIIPPPEENKPEQ